MSSVLLLLFFITAVMCAHEVSVLERDAQRFGDLVKLAEHSACARSAVHEMQLQCAQLSESTRRTLALRLLSCHLQSSGRQAVACADAANSDDEQIDCVRALSDVSFNLFTQFHIETESICFHVAAELRQERSMRTIALLHDASALAAARLETIVNSTNALSTSLTVITDWNRRIDKLATKGGFPGAVAALLAALALTSPSRTSAARVPCVALLSIVTYAEWHFDETLQARTALELGGIGGSGARIVLPISQVTLMRVVASMLGLMFILLVFCTHRGIKKARVLERLDRAFAQFEERERNNKPPHSNGAGAAISNGFEAIYDRNALGGLNWKTI
jgi:hypothetical protein